MLYYEGLAVQTVRVHILTQTLLREHRKRDFVG